MVVEFVGTVVTVEGDVELIMSAVTGACVVATFVVMFELTLYTSDVREEEG